MFDSILRTILGGYGEVLLDFYLEHNLIINGIIFLYAIIVSFSYKSYRHALSQLVTFLQENHMQRLKNKTVKELVYLLEKLDLPWDDAINAYWFPLIAQPRKLFPRRKKLEAVKELISLTVLADELKSLYGTEKNNG